MCLYPVLGFTFMLFAERPFAAVSFLFWVFLFCHIHGIYCIWSYPKLIVDLLTCIPDIFFFLCITRQLVFSIIMRHYLHRVWRCSLPLVTNVPLVCPSVRLLVTTISCAETGKPLAMPFGAWTWVGRSNHALGGGSDPPRVRGSFEGMFQAVVEYKEYPTWANIIR